MGEVYATIDNDLAGNCEPIPDSELDEKGHSKVPDGTMCTYREGKWWRVRNEILLAICDRIGPMPPDLKVVE